MYAARRNGSGGRTPAWADGLLGLALAGLALIEIWVQPIFQTGIPGPRGAVSALALLATLPVAWRRSQPLGVLVALVAGMLGLGLVADRDQAAFEAMLAMLAALYTVAAHGSRAAGLAGAGLVLAGGIAYSALTYDAADAPVDVIVPFLFFAAAWLVGSEVQRHRGRADSLADRASRLTKERDAAAANERARIARELHDAVAHSVGLTVMHVGAARLQLAGDSDRSRELLLSAEARGREALTEMRRMLGILRAGPEEPLDPVPSLRQLDELIERLRGAGMDVTVRVEGEPVRLAPGLDVSAYRIVQEALTNALKHGSGRSAAVTVSYQPHELCLEISNPTANGTMPASGHGLVGIEERVRLFAGSVSWGLHEGGWSVRARLPVERA